MAQKLYNDASVSAIADAIRSIDGDATLMKIADMPSRIQALMEHATTSRYGIVKLATQAEAGDTANAEAVITPATMSSLCHPNVISGLIQFIEDNQSVDITDEQTPADIAALLSAAFFPAATTTQVILKNGLALQWGQVTQAITNSNQSAGTITLPLAMSTGLCCLTTQRQSGIGYPWCITASINEEGTTLSYRALYTNASQNITTNLGFQWVAVGLV